jgi:hypothetical protein
VKFGRAATLFALIFVAAFVIEAVRPTEAMPPFAQAYGMDCQVCHTVVPALNAYGRYVQRTGYASLDSSTIHKAVPLWVGESPFYDTADPNEPHQVQWGNLALHAAGFIGTDFTFHVQQWVTQADQPGPLDTAWVTYNNLFHRDGHLFVGKLEAPAPSPFSQFADLAGFAPPEITVGEHPYLIDANRWGGKLAYTHSWFNAQVGYLGPTGDLVTSAGGGALEWGNDANNVGGDRTLQGWIADGVGYKPLEFGVYGGLGTFITSDGMIDRYNTGAGYLQVDPTHGLPGAFVVYQHDYDSHPGAGLNAATSTAYSAEVWEPFFDNQVLLSYRNEYTNDGLGTLTHLNYINAAWFVAHHVSDRDANGLIFNVEDTINSAASPSWQYQLWYATTVGPLHK